MTTKSRAPRPPELAVVQHQLAEQHGGVMKELHAKEDMISKYSWRSEKRRDREDVPRGPLNKKYDKMRKEQAGRRT